MQITPEARKRLSDLYSFLKAVSLRNHPPVRKIADHKRYWWFHDLPSHENLRIGLADGTDAWFELSQPKIRSCPLPPDELSPWLLAGWDDVQNARVERKSELIKYEDENNPISVQFDQHDHWDQWCGIRDLWRAHELPTRKIFNLWNELFAAHTELKKEGETYELVLGNGIFHWKDIHHPILLKRCQLSYSPESRTFTLSDTDKPSELYAALFSGDESSGLPIKEWGAQLSQSDLHPCGDIRDWLKAVSGEFPEAELLNFEPSGAHVHEKIGISPVVFLRKRGAGLTQFIDEVLQEIPIAESIPDHLLRIVGCYPDALPENENAIFSDVDNAYANEADDVLLSKEANAAQLAILRRLKQADGVLVQGPPGTGKTHTIANLLGNLLAEGKSVLVTSHTSKALKVLREQVSEPLRALCVPVLDSDKQGQADLQTAIYALQAGLSENPATLMQNTVRLRTQRTNLLGEIKFARRDLETAINGEYQSLVVAGREYQPVEAAKNVAEGAVKDNWIPGSITTGVPAPLSQDELVALYATNEKIPGSAEHDLGQDLPPLELLLTPHDFKDAICELQKLEKDPELEFRRDLWGKTNNESSVISKVVDDLNKAIDIVVKSESEPWRLAIIDDVCRGQDYLTSVWGLLCKDIESIELEARGAAELLFKHEPNISALDDLDDYIKCADEIISHLERGKSLSTITLLIHSKWSNLIKQSLTEGKPPSRLDHFKALRAQARLQSSRERLVSRWARLMHVHGAPLLSCDGIDPEKLANQFISAIRSCLCWYQKHWQPVRQVLEDIGLNIQELEQELPAFNSFYPQAQRLQHLVQEIIPAVVRSETKRQRVIELQAFFETTKKQLQKKAGVIRGLRFAINNRSVSEYEFEYARLNYLLELQPIFQQRNLLLSKVCAVAPVWARAIQMRDPQHGSSKPPGDVEQAWLWAQLSSELERRASLSVPDLQAKIERLSTEAKRVTTEVIRNSAWAGVIQRVNKNSEAKAALVAWVLLMKKIGLGKGKTADALRKDARVEMEKARPAVPVWIMPFSRLVDNFSPTKNGFDVIVVDEASQQDALGLAPFFMAKKVIVVGDHEQVTPLDVGGEMQPIQDLINQWLSDIPAPNLFDLKSSIYHRAQIAFGATIQLSEHFRCVPEIIQFSNHLSYDGAIKPLRDSASTAVKPALIAHRVNGTRKGKSNEIEAREIVSLIGAISEIPEYNEKSIGIIALLGNENEQVKTIEWLLKDKIDPVVLEKRRILCGSPAQFQGDERDIVFHSIVDSNEGDGPLTMKGDGADDMNKKRYNVAASRAKDQLWVVHSLDHQVQLKPGDLRRRLIEHAINPNHLMSLLEDGSAKTESPFEKEVFERLIRRGYRVKPQWQVGAYRIDLVVEGDSGSKLAVECDGDRYHYDKVAEDLARQALLERLGWRFVRIRGSAFYRNRDEAMEVVFIKLDEAGIQPIKAEVLPCNPDVGQLLLDKVLRRAAELRREWGWIPDIAENIDFEVPRKSSETCGAEPEKIDPEACVAVGDLVTYRFASKSDELALSVKITQNTTNPDLGLVGEMTPLAQALLGGAVGDEVQLAIPGKPLQILVIEKISKENILTLTH